jgi:hypothetical protein
VLLAPAIAGSIDKGEMGQRLRTRTLNLFEDAVQNGRRKDLARRKFNAENVSGRFEVLILKKK